MSTQQETTFSNYTKQQGQAYSQTRRDYHEDVYATVIQKHVKSGGKLDTVLDVGTGPGVALRTLAKHFPHAIGLDPSSGMIDTARSQGLVTATGEPVRFEVSTAEELGSTLRDAIADNSIDLITAANAAHGSICQPSGQVQLVC